MRRMMVSAGSPTAHRVTCERLRAATAAGLEEQLTAAHRGKGNDDAGGRRYYTLPALTIRVPKATTRHVVRATDSRSFSNVQTWELGDASALGEALQTRPSRSAVVSVARQRPRSCSSSARREPSAH